MALVVKFKTWLPSTPDTMSFNLPIEFDSAKRIAELSHIVISVDADGHEQELVLQRLKGLPHGHYNTRWTGDFARFIADNFTSLAK